MADRLWIITTGSYWESDEEIVAVFSGPEYADLDALQTAWEGSWTEEEVLGRTLDARDFLRWLPQQGGWKEFDYQTWQWAGVGVSTDTRRAALVAELFGVEPAAAGCPAGAQYSSLTRHRWEPEGTRMTDRFWYCCRCGARSPVFVNGKDVRDG